MIKTDIISGFLGAGKTTFIRKMIEEIYKGEKIVLIENEFGEVGVDGVCRAGFEAVAAVDAFVGQEDGFALANADGLGRARFHAMRAADASIFID